MIAGVATGLRTRKLPNTAKKSLSHLPLVSTRKITTIHVTLPDNPPITESNVHSNSANTIYYQSILVYNTSYMFRLFSKAILRPNLFSVVCLTSGPQPLPKPVLQTVRSSASSFNFQYPVFSFGSSSGCLRLLP